MKEENLFAILRWPRQVWRLHLRSRWAAENDFPVVRVSEAKRKFSKTKLWKRRPIAQVQSSIGNKELAWMFGNCFPNTLDTTVDFTVVNGHPDTYVITGDIDAMWLRDSSAQVWPYLPLDGQEDAQLQQLIAGVRSIGRRATRF